MTKTPLFTRILRSIQREPFPPSDDRGRMKMVMNSLILHVHPAKVSKPALRFTYTFGLGGLLLLLASILAVTGVLLIFVYTPSPDAAYDSMIALRTEVYFGNLIRNLHHWSGNLMVVVGVLHLMRVFYTAGFAPPRPVSVEGILPSIGFVFSVSVRSRTDTEVREPPVVV